MDNRSSILLVLCIAILTMNFRCAKDDLIAKPFEQTFQIPVDIYPLKKTYSLTDTIWISTDISGKTVFDSKSNQLALADTGQINFGASFNEFGTTVTNPPNGFCEIFTSNGVNTNRQLGQWGTSGQLDQIGCGQPSYKCSIGFKPLIKGIYWLILHNDRMFETCPNKVIPYYASLSYKFKTSDLGLEIFNSLPWNVKGGDDGIQFFTNKINSKELLVFKVE